MSQILKYEKNKINKILTKKCLIQKIKKVLKYFKLKYAKNNFIFVENNKIGKKYINKN